MSMTAPAVLVAGGAGYIGSHVCLALMAAGYSVVVIDDLSNSHIEALRRVERLSGRSVEFHRHDVLSAMDLLPRLAGRPFAGLIHLAGLKVVSESVRQPLRYYHVNVEGAVQLFRLAEALATRTVVFSSTASVYGAAPPPITELAPVAPVNPYGRTKLAIEGVLQDLCGSGAGWRALNLRYFNPVGAHPSGLLGEDPRGEPTNLFPVIAQVATGRRLRVAVYGADYPTRDGTGVRDFIHVMDLAQAHVAGLTWLAQAPAGTAKLLNIGTGRGYTVLEALAAWRQATGLAIEHRMESRRPGDVAASFADPAEAKRLLGWEAVHDLQAMCVDHWRWQQGNLAGYASECET